jgi:hypothetical protein
MPFDGMANSPFLDGMAASSFSVPPDVKPLQVG